MLRKRFTIAALIAAAAACSDTPSVFEPTVTPTDPGSGYESYPGILEAANLLRSGDMLIPLAGWQTALFANLVGAEVVVEGMMDPDPESGLVISDFQLLAVDGIPVLDGVLGEMEEEAGAYFVRTRNGAINPIHDVPDPLTAYVGRRVFVAQLDSQTVRYGLLEMEF
jgi:hypothetical protein